MAQTEDPRGARVLTRQQVLVLYLSNSNLDSQVVAWSFYDGASTSQRQAYGQAQEPPYKTGLCALRDGWRLLQYPRLNAPSQGREYEVAYLEHEFIFEKIVEKSNPVE